ncbi:putative mitochondrial protein [Andalucia godoyi]|uniref:Putative mitochondrial protein n=1 Tax=Andalucia godoyi TaxID=505711 RepID=A0A8K0AJL9_ANDGO|nr:putative mitochondrial protein [Andalucia godoyi]|eukprot:ANDGO_03879.mRNA.1 putative mitochondrial protein
MSSFRTPVSAKRSSSAPRRPASPSSPTSTPSGVFTKQPAVSSPDHRRVHNMFVHFQKQNSGRLDPNILVPLEQEFLKIMKETFEENLRLRMRVADGSPNRVNRQLTEDNEFLREKLKQTADAVERMRITEQTMYAEMEDMVRSEYQGRIDSLEREVHILEDQLVNQSTPIAIGSKKKGPAAAPSKFPTDEERLIQILRKDRQLLKKRETELTEARQRLAQVAAELESQKSLASDELQKRLSCESELAWIRQKHEDDQRKLVQEMRDAERVRRLETVAHDEKVQKLEALVQRMHRSPPKNLPPYVNSNNLTADSSAQVAKLKVVMTRLVQQVQRKNEDIAKLKNAVKFLHSESQKLRELVELLEDSQHDYPPPRQHDVMQGDKSDAREEYPESYSRVNTSQNELASYSPGSSSSPSASQSFVREESSIYTVSAQSPPKQQQQQQQQHRGVSAHLSSPETHATIHSATSISNNNNGNNTGSQTVRSANYNELTSASPAKSALSDSSRGNSPGKSSVYPASEDQLLNELESSLEDEEVRRLLLDGGEPPAHSLNTTPPRSASNASLQTTSHLTAQTVSSPATSSPYVHPPPPVASGAGAGAGAGRQSQHVAALVEDRDSAASADHHDDVIALSNTNLEIVVVDGKVMVRTPSGKVSSMQDYMHASSPAHKRKS